MKRISMNAFRHLKRLRQDQSGLAMVEFAYTLPILLGLSISGIELTNLAMVYHKLHQLAAMAADDVARVRTSISDDDINELVVGIREAGSAIQFASRGRIFISSVQPLNSTNTDPANDADVTKQKIRWQRCFGAHADNSNYGVQGTISTGANSIGPAGAQVGASFGTELIFVEAVYTYAPISGYSGFGTPTLRATKVMPVRDRISNDIIAPSTGSARTCSTTGHTST